jgi:hypothetical protein
MTSAQTDQRTSRRGRRGPTVAAVAVAIVAAVLAAAPIADPGVVGAQSADAPRLELTGQRFAFGPDGEIRLDYRLTGISADELELLAVDQEPAEPSDTVPPSTLPAGQVDPDQPPAEPPLELTIEVTNYRPLDDPDDVAELVGSTVDPDAFTGVIDGVALTDLRERATIADDGSIEFTLEIGTDVVESIGERLKFERPGLYPLRVQILVGDPRDDNVVATAGTVVQRLPGPDADSAPPIDLSVVTMVPAPGPGASAAELDAADNALDAALDLATELEAPTTLEVPPALVAAVASTPEGSQRLADALRNDELVALPVLPLDVSSAVAAERPDAFARLMTAGEDLLTEAVPTTPALRSVWITADELSGGGAQQLRDLGVRFVIMPAALYTTTVDSPLPDTSLFVEAELPDGGTLPLLVVDPLTVELTPRRADDILRTATPAEWSVTAAARLVLAADQADAGTPGPPARRSTVLTTPDLSAPDVRLLRALHELSATTPSLEFVRASSLIGLTDTAPADEPVTLPEVAGPPLVDRVALLDATALSLASAASMLPPDDERTEGWQQELDTLISTGYSDAEVEAVTTALLDEADAIRDAVTLPDPFTFTLTGRSGTIEVRLGNTSTDPLTVDLRLESPKVVFPEGNQTVTLRPGDQTSVVVPVEARSNGTSPITLTVSTPAGEQLDEPVTLTSRVTGFTGLRQVLTGGFILVLLTWWFTHWRAKRRAESIDDGRGRHPTGRKVGSDAL